MNPKEYNGNFNVNIGHGIEIAELREYLNQFMDIIEHQQNELYGKNKLVDELIKLREQQADEINHLKVQLASLNAKVMTRDDYKHQTNVCLDSANNNAIVLNEAIVNTNTNTDTVTIGKNNLIKEDAMMKIHKKNEFIEQQLERYHKLLVQHLELKERLKKVAQVSVGVI